ncbi:DUF4105 domain-containing protein [Acinetobacter qingfengensis]|uniref:Lnb N-terminal periplasmic domain-containing protein n=1 Tax=Acinetobacter qingfengensis TaxID=1262585 RepID=A0A1E7REG9_9GAMM|nr:DUF4105 domain-containing protein [Acinetobacter qingfengensis]KAA8734518.1 DUF4105 domain-containing protein [Acinetobacter qingfengensis]OEY97555.1 hypothetical protein BJI46_09380 [Acinetobacter qingfengensis]
MNDIDKQTFGKSLIASFLHAVFYLLVIFSSIWLCLALWIHQPFGRWFTYAAIIFWITLSLSLTGIYITQAIFKRKTDVIIYLVCFTFALIWFFSMPPRNDRDWNPEVAKILDYQQQGQQITIENVRNFTWHTEDQYDIHWETRHYDLSKLQSMDLILSYWAGDKIAHTLVSFMFSDGQVLSFSIEIRKEKHESFSSIGGFFRQYELAIVPADEKDIIFTRSNIRNERVYIYPVKMPKIDMQELFLSYLQQGKNLQTEPRWYNTIFSNCTTIIFDMVNHIEPVPVDIRMLLSGLLPSYLYDHNQLSHQYSLAQWQQMAFINPKVKDFNHNKDQSSQNFSRLIRSGLPQSSP